MDREQFYQSFNVVLDLALEAHELLRGDTKREIPGVREDKEQYENASVTTVTILNEQGETLMGKQKGNYVTIEAPKIQQNDKTIMSEISEIIAQKIRLLFTNLGLSTEASVLLVGLGNWEATPDSLGPRAVDYSFVTRHLQKFAPNSLPPSTRSVSALAPGVLGLTGIETAEIIRGVVEKSQPEAVIAIDALAARNIDRICSTIQIADTGINPGSGIGNQRAGINHTTMGIPVIAIGVPTVVSAAVIAFEVFDRIAGQNPQINQSLNPDTLKQVVGNVLEPFGGNLTVTPKEIDDLIPTASKIIADGLTLGLQPKEVQELARYLQ